MSELALNLTKTLTELLDHNEKRFTSQHTDQQSLISKIDLIHTRINDLESRCQSLADENTELKLQLSAAKQREDELSKRIEDAGAEIKMIKGFSEEFKGWTQLIPSLLGQITSINGFRDDVYKKLKENEDGQNKVLKKVEALDHEVSIVSQELSSSTIPAYQRTYMKSPLTSSFLHTYPNGHSQRGNRTPQQYHRSNDLSGEFVNNIDLNDDFSELSDCAETLRREVNLLDDLHRTIGSNE